MDYRSILARLVSLMVLGPVGQAINDRLPGNQSSVEAVDQPEDTKIISRGSSFQNYTHLKMRLNTDFVREGHIW